MNCLYSCFPCCRIPANHQPTNIITFSLHFAGDSSRWSSQSDCEISIRSSKTVLELKEFIQKKLNIPVDQQEIRVPDDPDLTFEARTLDDATKLSGLHFRELFVFIHTN